MIFFISLIVSGYRYAFKGYRGEVPTYYEFVITTASTGDTCSDNNIDFSMKLTGSIRKGTGVNEYLANTEHVYYRFADWFLSAIDCSAYHQPDVYFDLMTSDCPTLEEEKEGFDFDTWVPNYITFADTYLSQDGVVMNLIDSSLCMEYNPTNPPLSPTNSPSSNNTMIISVVIIIVIIIIIIVVIILLSRKNKKHNLKIADKPAKTETSSQTEPSYPQPMPQPSYPQPVMPQPMPQPSYPQPPM